MENFLQVVGFVTLFLAAVAVIVAVITTFVNEGRLTSLETRVSVLEKENTNATP